jgi:predicted transcriptional regulator
VPRRTNPDAILDAIWPMVGRSWATELSDEIRAKLMELVARRGERGFSALVEEALVQYLDAEERRRRSVEEAQAGRNASPLDTITHLDIS